MPPTCTCALLLHRMPCTCTLIPCTTYVYFGTMYDVRVPLFPYTTTHILRSTLIAYSALCALSIVLKISTWTTLVRWWTPSWRMMFAQKRATSEVPTLMGLRAQQQIDKQKAVTVLQTPHKPYHDRSSTNTSLVRITFSRVSSSEKR